MCVVFLEALQLYQTIRRSNVDFEMAAISPLDKTTSCPRSSIFSQYGFGCLGRNFRIFLRSSSFDLPFRKDVFSFLKTRNWRLEYSSFKRAAPFLIHCCSCKGCSAFLHPLERYFNLVDAVASCSLSCT